MRLLAALQKTVRDGLEERRDAGYGSAEPDFG
jgi:hypothetical protein